MRRARNECRGVVRISGHAYSLLAALVREIRGHMRVSVRTATNA